MAFSGSGNERFSGKGSLPGIMLPNGSYPVLPTDFVKGFPEIPTRPCHVRSPIPTERVYFRNANQGDARQPTGKQPGENKENKDVPKQPSDIPQPSMTSGGREYSAPATADQRALLEKTGLTQQNLENFTVQMRGLLRSRIVPLFGGRTDIDALSIGCGMMLEANAFLQEFPEGRYYGVDINDFRAIARMTGAIGEANESAGKISFSLENAEVIDTNDQAALMNRKWPFIFGRNIEFASQSDSAGRIVQNAINALAPNGVLLLTSFNDTDSRLGAEELQQYERQGKIRIIETNPITNPTPEHRVPMHDGYYTLAVKLE